MKKTKPDKYTCQEIIETFYHFIKPRDICTKNENGPQIMSVDDGMVTVFSKRICAVLDIGYIEDYENIISDCGNKTSILEFYKKMNTVSPDNFIKEIQTETLGLDKYKEKASDLYVSTRKRMQIFDFDITETVPICKEKTKIYYPIINIYKIVQLLTGLKESTVPKIKIQNKGTLLIYNNIGKGYTVPMIITDNTQNDLEIIKP